MPLRTQATAAVLAIAFAAAIGMPAALAQNQLPAQSEQDHKAHHPDGKAPPTPDTPQLGGQSGQMMGGMMCGDMKQMMSMMQDMHTMMSAQAGMMSARTEANIAKFKTDLKITDAQAPQWNGFADALRQFAKSMDEAHRQKAMPGAALSVRLAGMEKTMSANLNAVKALEQSLQVLNATLSDEQKRIADGLRIDPMGMM